MGEVGRCVEKGDGYRVYERCIGRVATVVNPRNELQDDPALHYIKRRWTIERMSG